MNAAGEGERLPRSIGGLVLFALSGSATALYGLLALGVLAAWAIAEYVIAPAEASTPQGQFKLYVLQYTSLFVDALVVAAVALGIAARAAGVTATPRALLGGAVERWLPVIAVMFLALSVIILTSPFSGLGPALEPRALVLAVAPAVWILWGVLGLAGPFVALGSDRASLLVITGLARAFTLSLHRSNLLRLCVLALVTVLPILLQTLVEAALIRNHTPRAFFWANAPIDALTIVPVSAVQTAFALDFARRAGMFEQPPPR
ncbi:MAG: hypothetical protein JWM87_2096 [Candidatus Eremiobacteraeota bacterium]|nr:hypothetical protein [Candidatus Eremiobacteraeota bacterium]